MGGRTERVMRPDWEPRKFLAGMTGINRDPATRIESHVFLPYAYLYAEAPAGLATEPVNQLLFYSRRNAGEKV